MGISMYLGYSQSQASSTKATLSRQIEGYTALQKALNDFVHNSGDLSGHAYDSAKAYTSTVLIPLTRACILLNEAIAQATADLPSRYVAEVDSTSLHEDQLVDLIAKADQTIVRYRKLWNLEYASDRPNYSLLNSLDRQIDIQQELKRKLQEKLDKLRAFHASSPQIFSAIDGLAQAVNQGMRQAKTSWNSGTQTFDIPSRGNLGWTKAINQQWLDRKVSKTSFKEQVDSLTLAELEKKYNDVLNASNAYVGAGYDGRYAGLKVSPEEADYIRSRYVLLKAQGQMSLYHKEMFDNLRDKDKDEIDKLDIFELTDKYPYLILPRGSSFEFGSDADYAKKNYLYYRFEELMAKQVIDWRDPQFMEKLNAHINETGINPITGKPATEAEITTAKLYTPVKLSSNILGVISLLAGPKVVGKYYSNSSNYQLSDIGYEIAVDSDSSPTKKAQSFQGSGKYPGVDKYRNIKLKKGVVLFRGEPGGTEYFTTESAVMNSGLDSKELFEGLQVEEHPIFGYRKTMRAYVFEAEVDAAYGIVEANPQFGKGQLPQVFVPDIDKLIADELVREVGNVKLK
ncbi:T7SS effector LXG polymorphic toxin [Streptococcus ruminantium]|uniref:T7SS effector LXG polymorphic toxin n=1 Tax=Streptococcus ruminantium TaxID=1917441 RepID=UPI0012DEF233|nr:T7SS effector LXG polymorphic toxin [Streptococcus ruminantium]